MDKLVTLELEGNFHQTGFKVTLDIRNELELTALKVKGQLPPAPEVAQHLHYHWNDAYRSLGMMDRIKGQKIIYKGSLNQRILDCRQSAATLSDRFQKWLSAPAFQPVDRRLRESLNRTDTIRFLIRSDDLNVQRLPWSEWDFFERYPQAELALGASEYEAPSLTQRRTVRSDQSYLPTPNLPTTEAIAAERFRANVSGSSASIRSTEHFSPSPIPSPIEAQVRILAILGHCQGINVASDRQILENLPHAQVEFLVEPSREEMSDRLWEQPWDILFFAGHSETEGETGRIYINPMDSLPLSELKHGLQTAIQHGLQLAIFNSCDGLGLVRELQSLAIAQMIVMREPVTDEVAQTFLRYFLHAFAGGESFYLATRHARERLQALEGNYPCASWLPIIYQHPLAVPPTWDSLQGEASPPHSPSVQSSYGLRTASAHTNTTNVANTAEDGFSNACLEKNVGQCHSTAEPLPHQPTPSSKPAVPSHRTDLSTVAGLGLAVTLGVMLLRFSGILQGMELGTFDRMLRSRPAETIDDRILVVEVTQENINDFGGYPLSDQLLADTIQSLQQHDPVAIALDMHRHQPRGTGREAFLQQFNQHSNLLLACAFGDPGQTTDQDYDPPAEFSEDQRWAQMGFSNFPVDAPSRMLGVSPESSAFSQDWPIRRQLLSYSPELATTPSSCITPFSLSFQLAYRLLEHQSVTPLDVNEAGNWQLGTVEFSPLPQRFGGYQNLEGYSDQMVLNPRTAPPGQQVNLDDVLQGNVDTSMVQGRVVLVGYTAPVARDQITTSMGQIPGVWVHAHMTSQIISAVLDQRALIWVLPQWQNLPWVDSLWVLSWSLIASSIVYFLQKRILWLTGAIALLVVVLYQVSLMVLIQGGWLPIIPTIISVMAVGMSVVLYGDRQGKQ